MAEAVARNQRWRKLTAKGVHELRQLSLMFFYLWVTFGLYVLNESVILARQHISVAAQGFAVVNALIFAKVMLIADDLRFGERFKDRPLIYPITYKAFAFSVLFIVVHICEKILVGVWHGDSAASSFPQIGGGTLTGLLCVGAILFVSLLPFFAFREIGRAIGENRLWNLMFRRRESTGGLR